MQFHCSISDADDPLELNIDVIDGVDRQLEGLAGADSIFGGGGIDFIFGGIGIDVLSGEDGDDQLNGGSDNDTLIGNGGKDTLIGGAGNDTLTATVANVTLNGGDGNDTIIAVTGNTISTGAGQDLVVVDGASATVATFATITDLAKADSIQIGSGANAATTFTSAAITQGAGATLQNFADAAVTAAAAKGAAWFQFGGDTYIVEDRGTDSATTFVNGEDMIIKIAGLVDLSKAVFNTGTGVLLIG